MDELVSPSAVAPSREDETLYSVRPSMFRGHPIWFLVGLYLMIAPHTRGRGTTTEGMLVSLAIGLMFFLWWLDCLSTRLTITGKRISLRKGILARALNEVRIADVRNIQTSQGPIQRLLGVGYVGVSTAGQAGVEIEVKGIPRPDQVRAIIDRQRG